MGTYRSGQYWVPQKNNICSMYTIHSILSILLFLPALYDFHFQHALSVKLPLEVVELPGPQELYYRSVPQWSGGDGCFNAAVKHCTIRYHASCSCATCLWCMCICIYIIMHIYIFNAHSCTLDILYIMRQSTVKATVHFITSLYTRTAWTDYSRPYSSTLLMALVLAIVE